MGDDCGTGVCFTRDPNTGEKRFFGEYLPNAQGEDVVAGIRTPFKLTARDAQATALSLDRTDTRRRALSKSVRVTLMVLPPSFGITCW
ncbi:MAG TPA: PEP/pyruvate-binding domain-containing protein [Nitrospira sp.]|nr:PEP/pyruvate-binding domain-containing protein [Nitrospira sp.]